MNSDPVAKVLEEYGDALQGLVKKNAVEIQRIRDLDHIALNLHMTDGMLLNRCVMEKRLFQNMTKKVP